MMIDMPATLHSPGSSPKNAKPAIADYNTRE